MTRYFILLRWKDGRMGIMVKSVTDVRK